MDKKGVEMSMNVIIIAVISLLVLVILVYLIATQLGLFQEGKKCVERGAHCVDQGTCGSTPLIGENYEPLCGSGKDCCALIG